MKSCNRNHSEFFQDSLVIAPGVLKRHCSYILAYRQKEGTEASTLQCGDLPLGHSIPKGYLAMTESVAL